MTTPTNTNTRQNTLSSPSPPPSSTSPHPPPVRQISQQSIDLLDPSILPIQGTNDDATNCKRSAVSLGYWTDPYLKYFSKSNVIKKAPEINRGYFARMFGIYHLILDCFEKVDKKATEGRSRRSSGDLENLVSSSDQPGSSGDPGALTINQPNTTSPIPPPLIKIQIINLGCGYDTLYFRLKKEEKLLKSKRHVIISNFIDVDFHATTAKKIEMIKNTEELIGCLTTEDDDDDDISFSRYDLHSSTYHVLGMDLRDSGQATSKIIQQCGINPNDITIFISECVLVYMDSESSVNLLNWITSTFDKCLFINYEQMNMTDRFGQIMLGNLGQKGCTLNGISHCISLESQKERFLSTNFTSTSAWTMNQIYKLIPRKELDRIESIELLDERELLEQLFEHYCICIGVKDEGDVGLEKVGF